MGPDATLCRIIQKPLFWIVFMIKLPVLSNNAQVYGTAALAWQALRRRLGKPFLTCTDDSWLSSLMWCFLTYSLKLTGGRNYNVTVVVLAVVLPTLAVLNLVACLCFWWRRRWRRPPAQKKQPGKHWTFQQFYSGTTFQKYWNKITYIQLILEQIPSFPWKQRISKW